MTSGKPLCTSMASNTWRYFPLIFVSHALSQSEGAGISTDSASARDVASPLAASATAPAAMRARNPRRGVGSNPISLIICSWARSVRTGGGGTRRRFASRGSGGIGDVRWRVAVGPVLLLAREVRARSRDHERRDIECLLVAKRSRLVERHVGAHEPGDRTQARHPGADVERAFSPEWRHRPDERA